MSGCHRAAQAAQGLNPCGKPCGVPGVAQGVPCHGPSAPASSPTSTYHIAGDHNTNYTTNNYTYVTHAGGAGATRGSHGEAAAAEPAGSAEPAEHAPQACGPDMAAHQQCDECAHLVSTRAI